MLGFGLGFGLVFRLGLVLGFGLVLRLGLVLVFGLGFGLVFRLGLVLGFGLVLRLGLVLVFGLGLGLVFGLGFGSNTYPNPNPKCVKIVDLEALLYLGTGKCRRITYCSFVLSFSRTS